MYSVPQLQALDYLLKRITGESSYPLYQKNLKFVVEINQTLWYGDFVQMENVTASQLFIDDSGDIVRDYFYATGSNAISPLMQIWKAYVASAKNESNPLWSNPFRQITDLALLFETLLKVLDKSNTEDAQTSFFPYLLDALSLDGRIQLPFINLAGEKVKLVSIIEIKN